jgi:transcriptional regulator with XRE-family HTH domain
MGVATQQTQVPGEDLELQIRRMWLDEEDKVLPKRKVKRDEMTKAKSNPTNGSTHSVSSDQPERGPQKVPRIGQALIRIRRDAGMSLKSLAELSGVSVGMLSGIERDIANPSLKTITKLRHALNLPVSAFFEERADITDSPKFVRRLADRGKLDLGNLGILKELLSAGEPKYLQFTIMNVSPGGSSGDQPLSYASEKAGVLYSGQLLLRVGNNEALLKTGDSFQFNGQLPHSFRNPGSEVASFLWIIVRVPVEHPI